MVSDDLTGRHIQDFVIHELIGHGGMAHVYRAHQTSVNRDVAMKIIMIDPILEEDTFARRFAQEAQMIASLEHIHILPIYAHGIQDDIAYIAMRLLSGGSISDLLKKGPIPLEQTGQLFLQFAQGLAYAHSKGVIHRDLKPSNVLLDSTGNAYLTDFGLAKAVGGGDLTKSGNIVGTPNYMAPEQLRGEKLDHRSDIYSLGVLLYHMLTGHLPFESDNDDTISIIYKHLEDTPEPPSKLNPSIPPEVEAVVLRALSKKPEDRFDSASLMALELKKAIGLGGSTSSFPELFTPIQPISPVSIHAVRRSRSWLWGGIVAISIVVLIAVLLTLDASNRAASQNATQTVVAAHNTAVALTAAAPTATPNRKPQVLEGEIGKAADVIPSVEEIQQAQAKVGANGFIALIACNQTSEYHAGQARELHDYFDSYDIDLRVYDSNTDEYLQLTLIEKARAEGASGLIVCTLNAELLDQTLSAVQKAQIPLVLYNPGKKNYGGVIPEGDNYAMGLKPGRLAGQIIRDEMGGKANVVILDYPDLPIIVERANGLEDGVLEFAPDAHIVGRYLGATQEFGKESIQKLIENGVDFDVIASINDAGSFGAIDALAEAEISPDDVFIVSVDAEALALQYIREGYYMRGSVEVARAAFSEVSVNTMIKLLAGTPIPEKILVPPGDVVTRQLLEQRDG